MYFSRIHLQRERISIAELTKVLGRGDYGEHQAIWGLFRSPEKDKRDFLFRKESYGSWPVFFAVSQTPPLTDEGPWQVETKAYEPKIRSGDRLAFSLRANPVVTRWIGKDSKRHARHDVVMDAKNALKAKGIPKSEWPTTPELVQSAGFQWLAGRAEQYGFAVELGLVRADGYRQHCFRKGKSGREVRLSTMEFSGILTVVEPELFADALFKGIGSAKGFGCGLLLIRRV